MCFCIEQWLGDYVSAYIVKYKLDGTMDSIVQTNIKQVYCPVCDKQMRYTECADRSEGRRKGAGGGEESDEGSGDGAVALGLEEMAGIWIISSSVMVFGVVLQVVQILYMKYCMRKSSAKNNEVTEEVKTEDMELHLDDGTAVKLKSDVVSPRKRLMGGPEQVRQEIDSLSEHVDWLLERMTELEKASAQPVQLSCCMIVIEYLPRHVSTCRLVSKHQALGC